jgi:phosphoserine aminotransferase
MVARPYNFSAGPAILPPVVFERAAEAVRELRANGHAPDADGTGLSILEISHRTPEYTAVTQGAEALCHEVLGIPRTHQVLFLQGGATHQFAMVPLNLRREGKAMCYVDTGNWSKRAIGEAQLQGETKVIATSAESGYDHIPTLPAAEAYADASYIHMTTNNTVRGTEFQEIPETGDVPLVIDASSHIGSRPMAYERVALGYAGAQKNLGTSGTTVVWIHKDLIDREPVGVVPKYFRYATHAKPNPSLYNTPNCFGTLVTKLVLEWIRDEGGVEEIGRRNREKAGKLYAAIDQSPLFVGHAREDSRSLMNVTFTLNGAPEAKRDELTKRFLAQAKDAGLANLKGHRSVGGCRASIYNAFPVEGVDALISFMQEFERKA